MLEILGSLFVCSILFFSIIGIGLIYDNTPKKREQRRRYEEWRRISGL